jgi:hopanoid biosynthesis associated radical SAM protein HpnH
MGVPLIQQYRVSCYLISQKLYGRQRYPLVLMLEPLFRCNLQCAGCGKIDYPEEILNRRLSVNECLSASDECGAPIVAISGGEPLIHEEMPRIVSGLIGRRKFVYLCTNGLLLSTRIKDYTPSPYLTLSVHLDGNRERHDALACRRGVFDSATEGIKLARGKGFRVTVNCTLYEGTAAQEVSDFFDFVMSLGIEGIMVSPAYRYAQAPQKDIFLMKTRSISLFREILNIGRDRKWRFNHSTLFLDFLAGNQAYACTPWGNPTRNIFGWQRPCYLLTKEGTAPSFKALLEETSWEDYGNGRNPKCANCMLHSGFEPTAVNDAITHPFKAFWSYCRGPRTKGPMASERPASGRNPSAPV